MPNLDYLLVFDAHDRASVKHIMRRNGARVALCQDPLLPSGNQRISDGRSRQENEASCPDCLAVLASRLATLAHHGRIDMDGRPHLEHVSRVVEAVRGEGWQAEIVATLHDVVTESGLSESYLREHFFPRDIIEAIWMLSRDSKDDRHVFLSRVGSETAGVSGKWARLVKFMEATDDLKQAKPSHGPPSHQQEREMVRLQQIREDVVSAMHSYREVTLPFREAVFAEKFTNDVSVVPGHILNG